MGFARSRDGPVRAEASNSLLFCPHLLTLVAAPQTLDATFEVPFRKANKKDPTTKVSPHMERTAKESREKTDLFDLLYSGERPR